MRIVFYSHSSDRGNGGVESLLSAVKYLSEDHVCFVIFNNEGSAVKDFKNGGASILIIPFNFSSFYIPKLRISNLRLISHIAYKWIKRNIWKNRNIKYHCKILIPLKPDIIYSNTSVISIGSYVANKLSLPHIWHLREFQNLDHRLFPDFGWKHFSGLLRKSDRLITNSIALKNFYSGYVTPDKFTVVYNGIDPKIFHPTGRDENRVYTFIMVGIMNESKGHLDALKAIKLLIDKNYITRLLFVGYGVTEDELKKNVKNENLTEFVEFSGFQNDVTKFYNQSDCYLMCSKNEAFGRVTVEAMLNELPVIGFKGEFNGTSEIIRNGIDGLLYSGTVEDLCEKMEWMLNNSSESKLMGKNGNERAKEIFSERKYISELEKIFIEFEN